MRILMHSCCAPCTTFPLFLLRSEGHVVDGVFLNSNISPDEENEKRWKTYEEFARSERFPVRRVDIAHEEWLQAVSSDLSRPGRCRACYRSRLAPVAAMAREGGYDCFTTSLLISPYQDHEGIVEEAAEASRLHQVPFLNRDFRVGYRRSREMARGRHLYMQKYCGCEFSARERER